MISQNFVGTKNFFRTILSKPELKTKEILMMPEYTQVKRSDLYNEVWTTSMLQLSKKYSISDRGLAKLCERHNIPTPDRGYWAKKSNGKNPRKRKLPNPYEDKTINIKKTVKSESETPAKVTYSFHTDEAIEIYEGYLKLAEGRPSTLRPKNTKLHPMVLEIKKKHDRELRGERSWPSKYGGIYVNKEDLPRAYKIVSIILRDFEFLGFKIKKNCDYWQTVTYNNESFSFQLNRTYTENRLKLELKNLGWIQDGPTYKMDRRLKEFCLKTFYHLASKVDQKIYGKILEKRRKEEERRLEIQRKKDKKRQEKEYPEVKPKIDQLLEELDTSKEKLSEEKNFINTIGDQFEAWQKSHQIRLFIEAKKEAYKNQDISDWLIKANAYADYHDPFSEVTSKRTETIEGRIKEIYEELTEIDKNFDQLGLNLPVHGYRFGWY